MTLADIPTPRAAPLTRHAAQTLAEQLAQRYAERIAHRLLAPGTRLPSVREGARRHGVSPSTLVEAYDRLQAQGLVEARPQRGFFVRAAAAGPVTPAAMPVAPRPSTAPVDATALIRSMFASADDAPSPALGTLPPDWLDPGLLQRALRRVTSGSGAGWLRYGDPYGDPSLRDALVRRLGDLGITARTDQLITTVGATHALDLVSRTLLQPGDAVLVDEPGWAVEYARLSRAGMRLLPVPRGPEGPDLAVMKRLLETHRPRLYLTVSVLHNPTGSSLSAAAAHQVLRLAEQYDLLLLEDDSYAWLAPPHATRLSQLDGLSRTIYVSGFSKVLVPQWRVGFMAAPPALAERLLDSKLLSTLTTPAPMEQALAWCLTQGALRRHVDRVVTRLAAARARTTERVRDAGFRFLSPPAGLFGWVDAGVDTQQLVQPMLDQGWLIAPGALFMPLPQPSTALRVNFAAGQDPRFWRALRQAVEDRKPT
ncbi:MAG: PLP-dependent aminotransferase family protein [Rubrivivax sp.]